MVPIIPRAIVLACAALVPHGAKAQAPVLVRAENTLPIARADETIALPWAAVLARVPGAAPARVRVVEPASGREVVSQVVDADGDGTPDELIFQATFGPGEVRSFAVQAVAPDPKPAARVHVMHDAHRDDVAWESDRIAWRIYGQGLWNAHEFQPLVSSGVDVWVKRVRDLVVDKWYARGHDDYHHDTGEGADFYDVGPTLGAGGTAVWRGDSMYRAKNFRSYRILADGPVRALFELRYDPFDVQGVQVTERRIISVDAGSNLSRAVSIFTAPGMDTIPYVVGVNKRAGMIGAESRARPWAWLTGWGPVNRKDGGHGELGTAVLLPRDRVLDWKETGDHYFAVSHARSGQPVVHYIGAGWTGSGDFRDLRDWYGYLDTFAQRLEHPLAVSWWRGSERLPDTAR